MIKVVARVLTTGLIGLWLAAACSDGKTVSLLGGAPVVRNQRDSAVHDSGPSIPPNPECSTNTDCAAPKAFCDTLAGSCVQCLANGDCPTQVCDAVAHTCTGCLTNADCPSVTPYCDRDDRRCVECESASQCPPGEVCALGAHRCAPACQTNSDCSGSGHPICAAASRVCVECTTDADCTSQGLPPYCDLRFGACVECLVDTDCASGHCYLFEHLCVECTSDAHCNGRICDAFICRG